MKVQGCDCSIVIKTAYREMDVPYSEETLRGAVSLLQEEAPIEGDGICRAIRKRGGVTGCVVTPLTIETAPLLLYLAMGSAEVPVFVSETRDLYQYKLNLLPLEDTDCFDLVQDRGGERKLFESCRVMGFELRIEREQAIKIKIDIRGEYPSVIYPPHEALGMKVPADVYRKSEKKYLGEYVEMKYGRGFKVRIVNDRGFINLKQKRIFIGNPFTGYHVGIKEFVDKATEVWFGDFLLGTLNQNTGLIEPSCNIIQTTKIT